MTLPWSLERGAQLQSDQSVRITLWAPRMRAPHVRISTGKARGDYSMCCDQTQPGLFSVSISNVAAGDRYSILADDGRELPDPVSRFQPDGPHGPSAVVDPSTFKWTDSSWGGVQLEDLVIYELHVGTFTEEGTFDAIIPRLDSLKDLGITAIEIMPVAQFPGARNWGYDGVGLYAPQNSYGGPDGLRRLVDAAHHTGLGVILDVVYNHVGPEGNYLDAFGPYFTEKYKTPWGRALNYDDAESDEVRRFVIDNASYWVSEFHLDGLRLDAVHGIFDFGAKHLLEEIAESVHAIGARRGSPALIIAESDLNDPKLIRERERYGYGLDAQWSDDFHHAVHSALTGEKIGYYSDYGDVSHIAAALREPFVYAGTYSAHRKRKHGAASQGVPRKRFVVAIQNHDQVGNRAAGDRLSMTLSRDQQRLAAALLILSPYVPLLFMGEEYGETNPFQYFISHSDDTLLQAVRDGRRREFESFGWGDDVPDPASEKTFEASRLAWDRQEKRGHRELRALYRDLLHCRREIPALRPDGATSEVELNGDVIALYRGDTCTLFNCSPAPSAVRLRPSDGRAWTVRLSTDAPGYGGPAEAAASSNTVKVPAWTALLLQKSN